MMVAELVVMLTALRLVTVFVSRGRSMGGGEMLLMGAFFYYYYYYTYLLGNHVCVL